MATEPLDASLQHLLRALAPRVLALLTRRFGDFAACEDAVQEALIAATGRWPCDGVPDNPRAWLLRVASRRLVDHVRAESARRLREALVVSLVPPEEQIALAAESHEAIEEDDTLDLLFMCCHPALSEASAIALTLRAVSGLTTFEIAKAFLVPEATMAQRIRRAKQSIKAAGATFGKPTWEERGARFDTVLHILYLIFNEGYATSEGSELVKRELSDEAIRLARQLHQLVPEHTETAGLLSLLLLTDARRAARTGPAGELIPLDEQDRSLWDQAAIAEGTALLTKTLAQGSVGPYQIQAAISALHDEAKSTDETDWTQILALYGLLLRMSESPLVALNHAVALAMVHGPSVGLERLAELERDPRLRSQHRLEAVRAHLLERAGDHAGAALCYRRAAERTTNLAERSYLLLREARARERSGAS